MTKGTPAGQQAKNAKNKPILLNKKLLIIKSNEDIKKLIKKENPTEEEVNELKAVLESSEKKTEKKKKKNIVIPRFKICEDDETYTSKLKTFEKPAHYIRYELYKDQVTGIKLTDGSIIHYDLLKEDELFLQSLNSSINIQLNDEDFCKLIDKFEKITGYSENKEEINLKDAIKATADLKINLKSNVVKDIHTYWKSKRKKLGRPLLRMFWNSSQNILPHYSVFRSRVKEKMTLRKHKKKNSEIILKMQELIEDFRRLDRILRKMKQRDEKKLLLLQLNSILFDQRKNEIKDKTYVCPMWNYFKDYKMEKIYKKLKKDKYYKSMYSGANTTSHHRGSRHHESDHHTKCHHSHRAHRTHRSHHSHHPHHSHHAHLHNDSIVSRKINKRAKSQGLCEQMNATKINRNEYQNVVLVKRRGRSNRIWVDRKFVSEMNNEDINCCDLSYTFNDFVEASLNLKKNYEEDLSNYISGKQKHIPIKLGIKSGDIKNLDSNFFSNQKNGEQQPGDGGAAEMDIAGIGTTAIGTSPLGNPDDGGVLFEKYEEMKKEKKRRKRKKESKDVAPNTSYDPINASPAQPQPVEDELTASHRYANGITGVPVEGNHNYFDYPSNYNNQKEDKRFFSSICSKGEAELIGNSSLWGKYNTNTNEAWNGKTKPFEDESPYPLMNLSNDKMENTLNEYKFTANGDANNKNANTNSVHSSEEASYNRALFQFEDLVNPQLNRDNYIFCLSKYACVQKRILFYLENMLNFDNYNFKSKKRESSTNVPRGASSGAAPVQLPHEGQNMDKGEQVQEVGNLVEPNHRPQEGIETIAPDTSDLLHIDTHN
ncbi:hypothetical protein, conserved in Apicomplexan species [Plasmodium knowlesi strain H]|uniref:Enhancer of polycomb-like protein n=3 Tax=Plasmodium knowlesi TaxID=5850 RepID=A0A5E7XAA7_PLAKH|nr:conserved protein, unknown function [Plasmodium knowlesi strain H]OTN63844.1 Uncharacterized protein PKNOH_S140235400 [Plasmodium knowlesi]CAA9990776.1 conserved protein, unknown function [Plasmodium knowlesi strain H]SBO21099.1 hypothetical protein, conserved in Apicomplexan species [Plasmodium knowlesi strain H]SBO21575.1 hypothetical protein, conserved in Apicomplexan species [Plasmodium knowlesi strain H]VVS80250.1 conserved protein, unknown function [Plasmodium knowlesi strain H]